MDITTFTPEQSAGQRLMAGFDGTGLNAELKFLIKTLKVGGIILFSRNLIDPGQIKNLCFAMQSYARSCGQPLLFIAIDQEGGQVARLKEPFTQFPGNPKMKGPEDAVFFAETTAKELLEVGINMDMAPVLDVAPEGINSVMADRAFGPDPGWVSGQGRVVIEHLQAENIMAVAKHFPGIGRTVLDSHFELPDLDIDVDAMQEFDLFPFKTAISHDVAGIMLSHIRYTGIDPDWPASLSKTIADDLLRKKMGYDGVVMTDDLDMGAIEKHYDLKTVIQQILTADIDMPLICHAGPNIENAFKEILDLQGKSQTMKAKGVTSLKRIMRLKSRYLKAK
ncbi:MAG: glycoside hydrolase family 3 protein [Deltaproteobacteria bacterium]|nr:glycoside hydrolase family 3 protein [Deltaproteobacteria bacterium]